MTRSQRRAKALASLAVMSTALTSSTSAFAPPANHRTLAYQTSSSSRLYVIGEQATSIGPAALLRNLKRTLPSISWLAEGDADPNNKIDIPDHVRTVLEREDAPKRVKECDERTERIRGRAERAAVDARESKGVLSSDDDVDAWWRRPPSIVANERGGRSITNDEPLTILIAGGGLAGLVAASAAHAKGMKVALFEQASSYAPYGGPIQIQSNALRAIQNINPILYEKLVEAGTCTADRVSGLKIGYRKGNKLAGLYDAGDWLVRFDTVGPALEKNLPPTVVVDRPVIQQILVEHGFPKGTVRIGSRIVSYDDLGEGRGVRATLEDGTEAYADVLVGADGIWSQVRKTMHGLDEGAGGFAASGAAGGALDDAEASRKRHTQQ